LKPLSGIDTPQYVLEVKNGYFPGGGCHGRRIHGKNNVDVMMPLDDEVREPLSVCTYPSI
jgi:hypothetical protein